jgi:hypothetical protein
MKRHQAVGIAALSVLLGGIILAAPAMARAGDNAILAASPDKLALIQENVVIGLTSGIPGQEADAAQLVRDLRYLRPEQSFSECVIPLMGILKNENAHTGARILAALALNELGSSRGDFAIERTAKFTSNPRVKHVCTLIVAARSATTGSAYPGMATFEPLEEVRY